MCGGVKGFLSVKKLQGWFGILHLHYSKRAANESCFLFTVADILKDDISHSIFLNWSKIKAFKKFRNKSEIILIF